jgi:hypothetical protein
MKQIWIPQIKQSEHKQNTRSNSSHQQQHQYNETKSKHSSTKTIKNQLKNESKQLEMNDTTNEQIASSISSFDTVYDHPHQCNIFISNDFYTNQDKLMIIMQGSGAVRAGQWARAL